MGFRSSWVSGCSWVLVACCGWVQIIRVAVGPLLLMGGHGFALHGSLQVLGFVVVAENGFDLGLWIWIWQ